MEQVIRGDVATALTRRQRLVVRGVPGRPFGVVKAEIMHFFLFRQKHLGVLGQHLMQRRRAAFLHPQAEEVWQPQPGRRRGDGQGSIRGATCLIMPRVGAYDRVLLAKVRTL